MRKLSFFIAQLISIQLSVAQSPHGENFTLDCANCHSPESWELLKEDMVFDHSKTGFKLNGQHQFVKCSTCHSSLKFTNEKRECVACHNDMHGNTLGTDCERCHTPMTWIVQNTTQMHQQSRFPLLGSHITADCFDCHKSANNLQFEPLGIECIDCHRIDYLSTIAPNHQQSGFSTNCTDCHSVKSILWAAEGFEHHFFPLQEGHAISCLECHITGSYEKISNECISCHQNNYNSAQNPNHQQLAFSFNCNECHSLSPGWKPAEFKQHDNQFFPIYTGEHNNEWNNCSECHTNSLNYSVFNCINCHAHNQTETNNEHSGINGYSYNSDLCFACHPRGDESGAFNHNSTGFPLTGAHIANACSSCHTDGFSGTSTECVDCHLPNYNQSVNPNHQNLGLAHTCSSCHSTEPDWKPASFPVHNNYFALTGAHANISGDCEICHKGNYNTNPNSCYACHTTDYNNTTDPNHSLAKFPTQCESCHSTNLWKPSTFNHDGQYFPIYSGKHKEQWNSCSDCHTLASNFSVFSCISCHEHNRSDTDDDHKEVSGYSYNSASCYSCHPKGDN